MTTKRQRLGITKKYRGYPKRATYLLNPLYLDELGQSFDEKHRVNIMDFVKNLSSEYSQMFMISHYHNGHGIFTNAQITILDVSNLRKIVNGGLNGYDEVRSVYIKAMKLL